MFRKNVAGQFIHIQGVDSATGGIKSAVSWTVRRCIDGTFAAGGGTVTEDGTAGWYKYAMAQADTNGNNIGFNFTGTGAIPQTVNIVTTAADPTTATNFGLSALPTANPGAAGGIFIAGTNAAVTITSSGDALTITSSAGNGNGINITGNGTGNGILSTGGATSGDGVHFGGGGTGHGIHALSGNGATGNGFRAASQATNGNGFAAAGNGTGDGLSVTGGTTGNGLHAVGGSAAAAGDGILAAVLGTGVPIRGAITGNITGNLSGSVGSVTSGVTVTTNNDKTGYSLTQSFPANFASLGITAGGAVTIDGTSALAESYRANGAAPTLSQGIHEILAHLGESSISGTTKTIKKLDHATTAETFTLDSATTPASVTRAT